MIDSRLIDSIRGYIQQGYTKQQIIDYLVSFGYPIQNVQETFAYVEQNPPQPQPAPQEKPLPRPGAPEEQKPAKSKSKIIIIAAIVVAVLLIGGVAAYFVATRAVCGNGELEEGENSATCCADAGCIGDQACADTGCVDPVCGDCQYLENHRCVDHECCDDDACSGTKECKSNKCQNLLCGFCQYGENHSCVDYECCDDAGCGEGLACFDHECIQGCGPCQYMVQGVCDDYQCCDDADCKGDEECKDHFCALLDCAGDEIALNHECATAQGCASNSDCDDSNNATNDICIAAGTASAHCVHTEADECNSDSDCDDGDNMTEDVCAGSPKVCSNPMADCEDFGVVCEPSEGTCNGDMEDALDTEYCCVGACEDIVDLYISAMDDDADQLEVEIGGTNSVNSSLFYRIYAFENGTRMDTDEGEQYHEINGGNATDTFWFNFTITGARINVTAYVDYEDDITESNESNNNMTIEVTLS